MLRTCLVTDDGMDVKDELSQEIILTVWRAEGESDKSLTIRAGAIARCINEEIRKRIGYSARK